jgi:hypothetical protein
MDGKEGESHDQDIMKETIFVKEEDGELYDEKMQFFEVRVSRFPISIVLVVFDQNLRVENDRVINEYKLKMQYEVYLPFSLFSPFLPSSFKINSVDYFMN